MACNSIGKIVFSFHLSSKNITHAATLSERNKGTIIHWKNQINDHKVIFVTQNRK